MNSGDRRQEFEVGFTLGEQNHKSFETIERCPSGSLFHCFLILLSSERTNEREG